MDIIPVVGGAAPAAGRIVAMNFIRSSAGHSGAIKPADTVVLFAALLLVPQLGRSQDPKPSGKLIVDGYSGEISVLQLNGRSYVDIEAFARLTNSSMSFRTNSIVLTLQRSGNGTADNNNQPPAPGFSKDFLSAAIELMTSIREWRTAIINAIQNSFPVTEEWVTPYQRTSNSKLALATTTATTESDRSGIALLTNELGFVKKFSDKYVELRKQGIGTFPDALNSDPLSQQILTCAQGMAAVAASGQFQDVGSCH
jgi:hypothetical protein